MSATATALPRLALADQARNRMRVMQVTDWLAPGGKERVAVNIANMLPRDRYESFLCTTRRSLGGLEQDLAPDVHRLRLDRTRAFEPAALARLVAFNVRHRIDVLHAHGSSLFLASLASLFPPYPSVVWHDHYGPYRRDDRPTWLYRIAASRVGGVIAVNQALLDWARQRLRVPAERTWYLPNFVCDDLPRSAAVPEAGNVPGATGRRVVCVAHLRPQKDHKTLLSAFALVLRQVPDAHLLLIGGHHDARYQRELTTLIERLALGPSVTLLGQRDDVGRLLAQSDIGVLSSESEGFPLALIEYGRAGLPAVATSVGQCAEILDRGRSGLLVEPADPDGLAGALTQLLMHPDQRRILATALAERVRERYSAGPLLDRICGIYDTVRITS